MFQFFKKINLGFEDKKINSQFLLWQYDHSLKQIQYILTLTAMLYILLAMSNIFLAPENLKNILVPYQFFLIPSYLLFIAYISSKKAYMQLAEKLLLSSPIIAALIHAFIFSKMDTYSTYQVELYLMIFWIFTISGLRFANAIIAACSVFLIGEVYPYYFYENQNIEYLSHTVWMLVSMLFGIVGGYIFHISQKNTFQKELDLKRNAETDALTGLPNRKYIFKKLEQLQRQEIEFSIVFLDLNRFKKINDSLGHFVGDNVLKKVAKKFDACVEENTFVGRLGGDEFLVIFENSTSKVALNPYLQKLHNLISGEYSVGEYTFYIGNSIGVASYPQDSDDLQGLLVCADKAMYKAKLVSASDIVFYSDFIRDYKFDDFLLEKELRKALESRDITVYLQPKFDTLNNDIVGYEALSRWKKDDQFISPDIFIPLAEETGLIKDITMHVIEETFIIAKKWHNENKINKISINISMIDFMSDKTVENIKKKIVYHGVDASWFELEVTESVFLENSEKISQKIQELIDLGFSIALDDFGTGYSSLAYLTKLPIHTLKIDKAFIDNLNSDYEKTFLLLKSIITIAKDLKFDLVIEGVETKEQLDILNKLGSFVIQGFYFYKPMSFEAIEQIEV